MHKILLEKLIEPNIENPKMKPDTVIRQTFTCCDKKLEKILWEGWDWIDGNIISDEIVKEFKYCPYCGKEISCAVEKKC